MIDFGVVLVDSKESEQRREILEWDGTDFVREEAGGPTEAGVNIIE